jgi:TM2 domain-containing membrane protein YozV
MQQEKETHLTPIGYLLWFFGGLFGYHRFYYGRQLTGLLWMFTLGVFFIGWVVDAFLIPSMNQDANNQFKSGDTDYSVAWVLMLFLGVFGAHRFYMGKIGTGILYLLTFGLLGFALRPVHAKWPGFRAQWRDRPGRARSCLKKSKPQAATRTDSLL